MTFELQEIFADGLTQSAFVFGSGLFLIAYAAVVLCWRRPADAKARPKARYRPRPIASRSS